MTCGSQTNTNCYRRRPITQANLHGNFRFWGVAMNSSTRRDIRTTKLDLFDLARLSSISSACASPDRYKSRRCDSNPRSWLQDPQIELVQVRVAEQSWLFSRWQCSRSLWDREKAMQPATRSRRWQHQFRTENPLNGRDIPIPKFSTRDSWTLTIMNFIHYLLDLF